MRALRLCSKGTRGGLLDAANATLRCLAAAKRLRDGREMSERLNGRSQMEPPE